MKFKNPFDWHALEKTCIDELDPGTSRSIAGGSEGNETSSHGNGIIKYVGIAGAAFTLLGAAFLGHYYLGWFNSLIVKPGTYDNYGCQGLLRNLKDIGKVVKVDICTCCEKFTYYYGKYAGKESYKPTDSIYITEKGDKYYLPGDDGFIQYRLVVPKYDHQETFLKLTDMYSEVMGEDLKTYEAWSKIHPNTTKIHLYDHTEKDADVAPLWEKILIENGVKIRVCIPSAKALDPSWKKNGKIAFLENGELYHKPKGEKFYTELKTHKFGSPPYLSYADSLEK